MQVRGVLRDAEQPDLHRPLHAERRGAGPDTDPDRRPDLHPAHRIRSAQKPKNLETLP